MTTEIFYNISKIIERDSKSSTYKFALLRGVIDIIQDNSPYISFLENRVHIPTGLLIEKWLIYYYPILQSHTSIPQINGETNLAFSNQLSKLIFDYETRGGFSAFYNDLKNKGIPEDLQSDFFELAKKLRDTITKMPMKYIGRSISNDFYSIFNYENQIIRKKSTIDIEILIKEFGTFSIPLEYYQAFKILGSFINGQDSILFKWAEFSVNASGNNLSVHKVLNEVLKSPITLRDVKESKKLYKEILQKKGNIYCVWTGRKISNYDIDHMIPFSIWKNNDLWNLIPSDKRINNKKRNKVPTPEIIERQKNLIIDYWGIIYKHQSKRFQKEIQVSLLGNQSFDSWKDIGISQLQNSCNYLIENRGFEGWKI
ncbi:HNH endonuclease domain-containing protein [Aequorivita echinoideorum]|uniref:HNH nuclease domain-containing protein n=1 Tax=Aequorivita echinoideorum TaxID=1549647 RepID=A0ABS5S2X8_9FLAO|nr:HNH endonuclease domain-containing protein [Aequorivita echinoideorum]MBT0607562.1 hypothetical protein [Aequorivita echinoideorum]